MVCIIMVATDQCCLMTTMLPGVDPGRVGRVANHPSLFHFKSVFCPTCVVQHFITMRHRQFPNLFTSLECMFSTITVVKKSLLTTLCR